MPVPWKGKPMAETAPPKAALAHRRTKIVATLGPASSSPERLRALIRAGVDVARFNFSHGVHADHAKTLATLRSIAQELDTPVTVLQDLQGPKIRVGELPVAIPLADGGRVTLVPVADFSGQAGVVPIDYPHLAEEAAPGLGVLLADGAFELEVEAVDGRGVRCRVVKGGELKGRKGVNVPGLSLRLPALTEKDLSDLDFGIAQGVDWVALSFVRSAADVRTLRERLQAKGAKAPVLAKIEKPQAVERLEEILAAVDGLMVARGDLGVEMSPERVPMIQKRIIELCNRAGKPVITATQMLESMIQAPRPTRAEASDVANAIVDGTDAVMLSGETSVGAYPVEAVEMMARIAREVESRIAFRNYPPAERSETHALAESVTVIEKVVAPRAIAVLTVSGHAASLVAAERPCSPVVALTTQPATYHALNLVWGVRPVLVRESAETVEAQLRLASATLVRRGFAAPGDRILVVGGVPAGRPRGTNYVHVHTVS
jgi:pyruvate kinase